MIKIFVTLFGLILPFYFFLSCSGEVVNNHTNNIEELGDDYYFLGDGHESQILLNLKPSAKSKIGKTIVAPEVIRYNFDDQYIIAESIDGKGEGYLYWLIRKGELDSLHPVDSLEFFTRISLLGLELKDR
ncbi:hypothetical protein [Sphingobacterium kitahiroshimense]|uniref:hypothetical protein n=1 Tax=Sphingobacterium kitahiroshimense TaxID=470446 RepID=UPI003207F8B8